MKRYVAKALKEIFLMEANMYNRREPLRKHQTTSQKYRRAFARVAFRKWMKQIAARAEARRVLALKAAG